MGKATLRLNKRHPKIFYRIGAISLQWNRAEYYLEELLKAYLNVGSGQADIFLNTWGNETRSTVLVRLVQSAEKDPAFAAYATEVSKFFNVCRENRNFVVHGVVRDMDGKSFVIERFTRRQESRADYLITLEMLEEVESEIISLCSHLAFLIKNNAYLVELTRKRGPLPDTPPLPRRLTETVKPIPPDEAPPPTPLPG